MKTLLTVLLLTAPALAAGLPDQPPNPVQIAVDLQQADVRHAYLLSYSSEMDDRPLYLESALVAVEHNDGHWDLDHVYRHPRDSPSEKWQLSVVFDAPVEPSRSYPHCPSRLEVEAFLKDSWWHFAPESGFILIKGEVYANTWEHALGYRPDHEFARKP